MIESKDETFVLIQVLCYRCIQNLCVHRPRKIHTRPIDGTVKLVTIDINIEAFWFFGQPKITTIVICNNTYNVVISVM